MSPADFAYGRGELGLTQAQLAEALDVNRATIIRWESGAKPIPKTAEFALNWLLTRHIFQRKAEQVSAG